jgi:transcriptional regulator with XRE-family HTH domain
MWRCDIARKRTRFVARRKALGYSQEQLAEHVRVERSTIARWESGETAPQPWFRPKVARALQLSLEQLDELNHPGSDGGSVLSGGWRDGPIFEAPS